MIRQSSFFVFPEKIDVSEIKPSWNDKKQMFFLELIKTYKHNTLWQAANLEKEFKDLAATYQLKPGELMSPFRIMLVGSKFGPGVFEIASVIDKEETIKRIEHTLSIM